METMTTMTTMTVAEHSVLRRDYLCLVGEEGLWLAAPDMATGPGKVRVKSAALCWWGHVLPGDVTPHVWAAPPSPALAACPHCAAADVTVVPVGLLEHAARGTGWQPAIPDDDVVDIAWWDELTDQERSAVEDEWRWLTQVHATAATHDGGGGL